MYIYSGNCRFCEVGIPTNWKDVRGKELFTGDIVLTYTKDYAPDGLTVIVRNDFTSYDDGTHVEKIEIGNPFPMGIADTVPTLNEESGITEFIGQDDFKSPWFVRKVKSYKDVLDGEHWQDFGFNYKEN